MEEVLKFGIGLGMVEERDGYVGKMKAGARCELGAQPGLYACSKRTPVFMEKIDDAVQELWWEERLRKGCRFGKHSVERYQPAYRGSEGL